MEKGKALPKKCKARRGHNPKWPEMERELRQWIINKRRDNSRVTTTHIRLQAHVIARSRNNTDFTGTNGWYCKFMKRNGLSVRCRTSVGQPLPEDWTNKAELFRAYVAEKKSLGPIPPENIFNTDEVPCQFDMVGNRTVAETGAEDITIRTTGAEKSSFTVVLGVNASGEKLKPLVIFKRKTIPKEKITSEVLVRANPKGWINGNLVEDWMDNVFMKRTSGFFKKPAKTQLLLIYDSCKAHLTEDVKAAVQKHAELAVIHGGLTKHLQPLDISVNKSFKGKLRASWDKWMIDEEMISLTKSGNRRRASYAQVCSWIAGAWKEVDTKIIKNGFKKAGLESYAECSSSGHEEMEIDSSDDEVPVGEALLEIEDDDNDDLLGDVFDGFAELDLKDG